jgi:hypothetical protein
MAADRVPTWRERLLASDPGSVRLALATRAAGSLVTVLGVAALAVSVDRLCRPTEASVQQLLDRRHPGVLGLSVAGEVE